MRDKVDEAISFIRAYIEREYAVRGNHQMARHIRHIVIIILPIVASYIIVQMGKVGFGESSSSAGIIGYLWNSTIMGAASFVLSLWNFTLSIVGITLGIGLGLGFAGHVYDTLSDAQEGGDKDAKIGTGTGKHRGWTNGESSLSSPMPNLPKDGNKQSSGMEDANSYHSLMRSAGYSVDSGTLRAQVVRGAQAEQARKANEAKRCLVRSNITAQNDQEDQDNGDTNSPSLQHPRMSVYKFDEGTTASTRMKCMWPMLSPVINDALGKLTEFVLRDYVSSWYSKVDEHVVYVDPEQQQQQQQQQQLLSQKSSSDSLGSGSRELLLKQSTIKQSLRSYTTQGVEAALDTAQYSDQHSVASSPLPVRQQERTMVLTTTGTQSSPFIDSLYHSFAYLLGMLATRSSENVNILELLLLHFPYILGQNLRVYREMKNVALKKKQRRIVAEREKWRKRNTSPGSDSNISDVSPGAREGQFSPSAFERSGSFIAASSPSQEGEVSEVAIVREYLLAGRFHRAVTFGLDVPSLLFADPLAKDTPPGPSYKGNTDIDRLNGHPDEDAVLDDRLLSPEATLIEECELDYQRVLASKLSRMTVQKTEIDSAIVRTMLNEMLASCVLGPVMGCFCPDTINGWLITGLGLLESDGSSTSTGNATDVGNTEGSVNVVNGMGSDQQKMSSGMLSSNCSTSVVSEDHTLFTGSIADDAMDDLMSEASVGTEMEERSLYGIDDKGLSSCSKSEQIITMLSMSIIELRGFVDFDDVRYARETGQDCQIDWDAQDCRDSVRHLVLVIEAALLFGIRSHPKKQLNPNDRNFSTFEIEATLDEGPDDDEFEVDINNGLVERGVKSQVAHQHSSLSAMLMELTGDIEAFEKLVEDAEQSEDDESLEDESGGEIYIPKTNELSTFRTLIAAWLHTGQAFRVISIVVRAKQTVLRRYYHKNAFLRRENYARDFTQLLRQLDGVDILVDTMAVLASQCLLVSGFDKLVDQLLQPRNSFARQDDPFPEMVGHKRPQPSSGSSHENPLSSVKANIDKNRDRIARFAKSATEDLNPFNPSRRPMAGAKRNSLSGANAAFALHHNNRTPTYLQFSTNEVFASSLRSERERRDESWLKEVKSRKKSPIDFVCRTRGMKDKDITLFRELHHLTKFFCSNTSEVRIEPYSISEDQPPTESAANITLKAVGPRRKIEVPDEDSSFLMRSHIRPLKPVAIQRKGNVTCKVYLAMYEEPAIHPRTKRYYGGRYLRQCLMKYYPNDKSASVQVSENINILDLRQEGKEEFALTEEFQKLRHTCLKVATGGILSSPVMEPDDFCSTLRSGRAVDFAHRLSLFERPLVELGGKKFLVCDASAPRADASSLELSDAAMTAALILRGPSGLNSCDTTPGHFELKMSNDEEPLILLRANGTAPNNKAEARPYKPSFIRAALLVKSAKQEAQSQCLHHCIKNGFHAQTKIKSDEWLQPALTLLQYANSRRQEEQSALLRDLRFGINHIDRGQLRRNGILNPRHPTFLRGLTTKVEGVVEVKQATDFDLLGSSLILFRIRCTAIAEYVGEDDDDQSSSVGMDDTRKGSRYFREEWTVLRSLRDFGVFHKHMKNQVAPTEHSASAGAKIVGSVKDISAAALTIVGGAVSANERQKGPLVPSLSQATKPGTLGLSTKKVMERRKKLLDQYLKYLASPNNLLCRSPELLKFLGAFTHLFPADGSDNKVVADEYGREGIRRVELITEQLKVGIVEEKRTTKQSTTTISDSPLTPTERPRTVESKASTVDDNATVSTSGAAALTVEEPKTNVGVKQNVAARKMAMIRAGEIRLKDVRRSIFRLLKYMFDLDNANFFRNRIISVLKTMSVAVASVQDFQLLLFRSHVNYVNGEYIAGWIVHLVDMFWPDGVFYTRGPPLTEEEQFDLRRDSKDALRRTFPDQLRTVLGKHTDEGLDILHEMLQNRLVLKSIGYMIMDLVWVELFPELGDEFFTGAEALEKEA